MSSMQFFVNRNNYVTILCVKVSTIIDFKQYVITHINHNNTWASLQPPSDNV